MQDTDRDFFMSAFEAKEYGLIDSVIEHPTDVAVCHPVYHVWVSCDRTEEMFRRYKVVKYSLRKQFFLLKSFCVID